MGTWGTGPFDGDQASDFVSDYFEQTDQGLFLAAFNQVNTVDEYIEADVAQNAVAAATLLSIAVGKGQWRLPAISDEEETARLKHLGSLSPISEGTLLSARSALEAIARDSELRDLWLEGGETVDSRDWFQQMTTLMEQLKK